MQVVLTDLLGLSLEDLGFTPPWGREGRSDRASYVASRRDAGPMPHMPVASLQPPTVGKDFRAITRSHRNLYWSVTPSVLHPAVLEHARLGIALLEETASPARQLLAAALAESYLLAGRIEFFDLSQPDQASETLMRALQAASQADDSLLGSAVLAHLAFIPGWAGDPEAALERMVAARAYARREEASAEFWAWLDAVEAECETRCGHARNALKLISEAEDRMGREAGQHTTPDWMDWFSPTRLAAFKGNTLLNVGHLPQARQTLQQVLNDLPAEDGKQRTVILGDLAMIEATDGQPEQACQYASQALDQLAITWYATGLDRVREVRRALADWQNESCVRDLDDRLYDWGTTVNALLR
ncbi:hypothetical protein [Luteipulveratus mongoliensis]|uniref:hypothetical protein n=1 Tax=Luteipulveratus mongoliensis TaxID=571913 RepID=UPI001C54D70D|nr:hypothetical protein [Luteipulveratus mongoliensis]